MADIKDYLNENGIPYDDNKYAKDFTTFKIGGRCFAVYPGDADGLVSTVRFCRENGVRYTVIGCGSNVLFSDNGFDGVVIITTGIKSVKREGNVIKADCGAALHTVCKAAYNGSLTGLEFAYGIPGSIGGAVFMNAGAYGGEMKDVISKVTAYSVRDGKTIEFDNASCGFGYRNSVFTSGDHIVLSAEISLEKGDKDEIKAKMDDLLGRRKSKQPLNYPSAGSAFKRYPGRYTGQMIEEAGLKGYTVGGAQVSEKHAGFIINKGGATADDVMKLIGYIKEVIRKREGVEIEPEIRVIY